MSGLEIFQFPCLEDNFGVLVHDETANLTAAIDAPEAAAVESALEAKGWTLTHIFVTHHHHDHIGGIDDLKAKFGCRVVGPNKDSGRIRQMDEVLAEGDVYDFGSRQMKVFETPGHTSGHIVYWFEGDGVAFTGDTLFSLGCGRLFERPAPEMWTSLQKIMSLPEETQIYCGHEYTLANGEFALSLEPGNDALIERMKDVRRLRAVGQPTLPTTLGQELATNPFLRPSSPEIREVLGMTSETDGEVFAEIRARKDRA